MTWTHVTLKAKSPSNDGVHIYKHTFTGLQKNTAYVTRIQARNLYGFSKPSEEFIFRTPTSK